MSTDQKLPNPEGRTNSMKKVTALITSAAVAAGLTVGGGLALAAPAEAHTYTWSASCQYGVDISLTQYHDIIPGKDAVPAVDPIPATYKDWDETVVVTPGKDAVPDKTVPDGFEKYTWTAPHGSPSIAPPSAGWNDEGKTNDTKGSTPDTILRAGQGHSYFYFKSLTKVIPGTPAVPPVTKVVHHHDLLTPAVPGVPGQDAVAAKANHVTLTDNGNIVVDKDFGKSYSNSFETADKTIDHTYVLTVTSLDGIGAFTQTKTTKACETKTTPVTGTPKIEVQQPDCDRDYAIITYDIPEGLSIAGYTGTGTLKSPGDVNLAVGDNTFNVDVVEGYTYDGPSTVTVNIKAAPTDDLCAGPQPESKVTSTEWVESELTCDSTDVTLTREVTTTPYILEGREWVLDTENATTVTETDHRDLTAEEKATLDQECAGPQPEAKVTFGEWQTAEYGCGDTTVSEKRTVTTTPYKLEGREWVLDTDNAESVTETHDRKLTEAEIKALDCPVTSTPTPKPTATANPAPVKNTPAKAAPAAASGELAQTGSSQDIAPFVWGAGILVLGGIVVLTIVSIRRRKDAEK